MNKSLYDTIQDYGKTARKFVKTAGLAGLVAASTIGCGTTWNSDCVIGRMLNIDPKSAIGTAAKVGGAYSNNPKVGYGMGVAGDTLIGLGQAEAGRSEGSQQTIIIQGDNGGSYSNPQNNISNLEDKFFMYVPTLIDKTTGKIISYSERDGAPAEFEEGEKVMAKGIVFNAGPYGKGIIIRLFDSDGNRVYEEKVVAKGDKSELDFRINAIKSIKPNEVYTAVWYNYKDSRVTATFTDGREETYGEYTEAIIGQSSFKINKKEEDLEKKIEESPEQPAEVPEPPVENSETPAEEAK